MGKAFSSPMLRVTLAFLPGVALYIHEDRCGFLNYIFYGVLLISLLIRFTPLSASWRYRRVIGAMLYLSIFLGGYHWAGTFYAVTSKKECLIPLQQEAPVILRLKIITELEQKSRYQRAIVKVYGIFDSSKTYRQGGFRCLLYLGNDSTGASPGRGDLLLVRTVLQSIPPPSNPYEFDFRTYMARKYVAVKAYVRPGEWACVSHSHHFLYDLSSRCKRFIMHRIREAGLEGQELVLAGSLLLGDKDGLEKDLRDSFSAAGAMHVLCVSGLHVGILFFVLNFMLRFITRWRYGSVVRFAVVAAVIWLYALVTGLSPSVVRASLMFSILHAGKLMSNPPPTTNTLAASAMIITCTNPMAISNVGFQLSYLAVYAIVQLTPYLQSLWQPAHPVVRRIWSLLLVSLAAQIGTAPLALHYFHQFPVWFLLTNLLVIPLATVIIYLSMAVIIIPVPEIFRIPGFMLDTCLSVLSGGVQQIESLPGAVISHVYLSPAQTLMVYAVLMAIFLSIHLKLKHILFASVLLMIVLMGSWDASRWKTCIRKELYIYNIRGYAVIDVFLGGKCYSIQSTGDIPERMLQYSVQPNRIACRIDETAVITLESDSVYRDDLFAVNKGFVSFAGQKILIAGHNIKPGGVFPCTLDVLVISEGFHGEVEGVSGLMQCREVVIDSSVPPWRASSIQEECLQLGIKCHAVPMHGAYTKRIE